jgi:hypothetical protein
VSEYAAQNHTGYNQQNTDMPKEPPRQVVDLARTATKCRVCFTPLGDVVAPDIDIAQPMWVGPKYWTSNFRVTILMCNPGQGSQHGEWAKEVRAEIRAFRDGTTDLRSLWDFQRDAMDWSKFYIEGLHLNRDEVAFANVAWCATKGNCYPDSMLQRCFRDHTGPLLRLLRPNVVIAAGRKAQAFAQGVREMLPKANVINTLHHAHREGRAVTQRELAQVRSELAKCRRRADA